MPQSPNMWGPWTSIDRTQYPRSGPPNWEDLFGPSETVDPREAIMPEGSYPKAPQKDLPEPLGVPYSPLADEGGSPQQPSYPSQGRAFQGLQNAFQSPEPVTQRRGALENPAIAAAAMKGGGSGANDPLELLKLQEGRQGELEDRIANSQGFGGDPRASKALEFLNRDIAESPYTGEGPRAENAAYMSRLQKAKEQGFGASGDPIAAANEKARAMEEAKINMPLSVAKAQSEGDLAKQRLINEGGLAGIEAKGAQAQESLSNIRALLAGGGPGGAATVQSLRSVNPNTGAFSLGAPQKPVAIPPALDRTLATLRKAVADKGETTSTYFGLGPNKPTPEKIALDQTISSILARHPAAPQLKEAVQAWAKDPRLKDMDLTQILTTLGEDQVSPEEMDQLQELLYYIRGK